MNVKYIFSLKTFKDKMFYISQLTYLKTLQTDLCLFTLSLKFWNNIWVSIHGITYALCKLTIHAQLRNSLHADLIDGLILSIHM